MSEEAQAPKKLTNKQRIFIDEYLRSFNATRSAIKAGYSEKTARAQGSRLLTDVYIKAEVDERLKESHMSADEALKLLAEMARGDMGDFITDNLMIDLSDARERGITKLIRKIRQRTITRIGKGAEDDDTEITDTEIELYSAKDAIDTILKAGGALKDVNLDIRVTLSDD